jgi:hypothetical protein
MLWGLGCRLCGQLPSATEPALALTQANGAIRPPAAWRQPNYLEIGARGPPAAAAAAGTDGDSDP